MKKTTENDGYGMGPDHAESGLRLEAEPCGEEIAAAFPDEQGDGDGMKGIVDECSRYWLSVGEIDAILEEEPSDEETAAAFAGQREQLEKLGDKEDDDYNFECRDAFDIVNDMTSKLAAMKVEREFYRFAAITLMESGIPLKKQEKACRSARRYVRNLYGLDPSRAMDDLYGNLSYND